MGNPDQFGRPRGSGRCAAGRAVAATCVAIMTVASCGDGPAEPIARPQPASVSVDPPTIRFTALGATVRLEATVRDQNGRVMRDVTPTWSSTAEAVAAVDAGGLVTSVGYGAATVSASVRSASGSAAVLVTSAESDRVALEAFYGATDGPNWIGRDNWLTDAPVANWSGVRVDDAGQVVELSLGKNALYGPVPAEIGDLANLEVLLLPDNSLGGPLPKELSRLEKLHTVNLSGNRLTGAIPAELGNLGGLTRLNLSRNLLTESIPEEIDGLDALRELDLSWNRLTGPLPASLGNLRELMRLELSSNRLTGSVPRSFLSLELFEFRFGRNNNLCAPGTTNFIEWAGAIRNRSPAPPERISYAGPFCNATDVLELESLYYFAGGENWTNSTGWLEGIEEWLEVGAAADPTDWYGVTVDSLGRVQALDLTDNGLVGRIWGLHRLESLIDLKLGQNRLDNVSMETLGDLPNLEVLDLSDNDLYGSIPGALGKLRRARVLDLSGNRLVGPIPPELGQLAALRVLDLSRMRQPPAYPSPGLNYAIPVELGRLSSLEVLDLRGNRLRYSIPAELGSLSSLRELLLADNELSGNLPTELGELANLERLDLAANRDLTGPLPLSLASLPELGELALDDTGLCAPRAPDFLDWLAGRGAEATPLCVGVNAYLTQSVQSLSAPVPLVAGEPALLRVFVASPNVAGQTMPPVRARFYRGDTEVLTRDLPAGTVVIPAEIDEGSLGLSLNADIPGWVIQPGLEVVLQIDPDGSLQGGLDLPSRFPEAGRLRIDVRAVPPLDLTVIPFLYRAAPDSSILHLTANLAADDDIFFPLRTLLPVGELRPVVHPPVTTFSNHTFRLAGEAAAIRRIEGGVGHYMATMAGEIMGPPGAASRGSSFAVFDPWVMAQQLGSSMGLNEAPCDGRTDWFGRAFPNGDGSIGDWGYDRRHQTLVTPERYDLMSECEPRWISGFHFTRALDLTAMDGGGRVTAMPGAAPGLLLWGGVEDSGVPHLEPAFVVDAPPWLPRAGRDYRLTGSTTAGTTLFSLAFDLPRATARDGGAGFAFVLPLEPEWANLLARLTLSGPGGAVTLDENTDRPTAILRDSSTGSIRAILRGQPGTTVLPGYSGVAIRDGVPVTTLPDGGLGSDLTLLFSRGLPYGADRDGGTR